MFLTGDDDTGAPPETLLAGEDSPPLTYLSPIGGNPLLGRVLNFKKTDIGTYFLVM